MTTPTEKDQQRWYSEAARHLAEAVQQLSLAERLLRSAESSVALDTYRLYLKAATLIIAASEERKERGL